jgi:hypothetical protein
MCISQNSLNMVSSDDVKTLMQECFPKCPICYQSKGYDVLGVDKDYISCKKCFATWQSDDFSKGTKLSKLKLTQPSKEGVGSSLLKKTFSIDFWQNWREEFKAKLEVQAHARANSLLQCDNAILTNKEFRYRSDNEIFEKSWLISDISMAIVQDNGSLLIIFKDETKKEFSLGVDVWTKVSEAGILLFGGIGTIITGNMAINNKIKATSQQWASAINMLISKGKLPEMVYCKYCGTKNKSTEALCIHCGAILA